MHQNSRLQFTGEERTDPILKKPSKQVDEMIKKKGSKGHPKHAVRKAPGRFLASNVHQKVRSVEQDNVGVESAHHAEEAGESTLHFLRMVNHSNRLKPYRNARRVEEKLVKENGKVPYPKGRQENPALSSNSMSRFQQKQAIKREYAKARQEAAKKEAKYTAENTKKAARKTVQIIKNTIIFLSIHKKAVLIIAVIVAVICILLNCLVSGAVLLDSALSAVATTSYLSDDEEMIGAEEAYAQKEENLRNELEHYEQMHPGYDEYHYDFGTIGHDPYVLISILTVLYHRFTYSDIEQTLNMLYERQYVVTRRVVTETRYRTEQTVWIDEAGIAHIETYQVPYDYSICYVEMENQDLSHIPAEIMNEEQLSRYAAYMAVLGNRPDLFLQDQYPNVEGIGEYLSYEIPPEALDDETFAAMIKEAEKYLGYPYVWGGSNPSTSFDCSGYVSWVINHSGWNVGRRTAQGLFDICTPVASGNAKPGDLIFFVGTYDTPGVSHVAIYVGENMMIHAGKPISYASFDTSYWQEHFYAFGRLPGN